MYISLRSPRGGSPISSLWSKIRGEKNINLEPEKKPEAIDDYIVWRVGYCEKDLKAGEAIFIKRSDAKRLKGLILHELLD